MLLTQADRHIAYTQLYLILQMT